MARVLLGLDLGASKIAAVVAVQENDALEVTGASLANPRGGIKQGEITDLNLTVTAITKAVGEAMRTAGRTEVDGILVSVGGIQFKGENSRYSVTISSPDREITSDDKDRVMEQASSACKLTKEETILHKIPQMFHIKGQRDIKNPVGMIGDTLEAEVRIIVAPGPVLVNINRALQLSGLPGPNLCYSPLASAKAVLKGNDAENGAVVVDIGDHLTHLGVFMRGALFHSAVIPVGGMLFTRDLESTMQLGGINAAEMIKRKYGTVLPSQVSQEEMIEVEDEERQVSRRKLAEVLHYRALDIIDWLRAEIGRSGIVHEIHGGVHLVGGGALLPHLAILTQNVLGRPRVVLGKATELQGLDQILGNPLYINALGAVKKLNEDMKEREIQPPPRENTWLKKLKEMF